MKNQALLSSKDKSKTLKYRLLKFFFAIINPNYGSKWSWCPNVSVTMAFLSTWHAEGQIPALSELQIFAQCYQCCLQ